MGFLERFIGVQGEVVLPQTEVETRSQDSFSIGDPALAEFLGLTGAVPTNVTDSSALGVTAFYRGVSIIAGTIAGLPLKTYSEDSAGTRTRTPSFLDRPAGPYPFTPFAWKELIMVHLLIRGETFLLHVLNGAGAIVGLLPVHPSLVTDVEMIGAKKRFTVYTDDGRRRQYTSDEMTHVMALTLDGIRGCSPLSLFRNSIRLALASDRAAERSMNNGMLIAGLVTPDEDLPEEDAIAIKEGLKAKIAGAEHAGDIAVVNRALKFSPWAMTNEDAQFIESREFQVIEFARMLGIPPHLLAATEKQTSWGTGVAEQNLGLARYTLMGWTSRIEEALSQLLPSGRFCEFDYTGLLQGTPAQEIELLIKQVEAGLLTPNEARAIRNLPPLPVQPEPKPEASTDEG
jgi:HK97 family phage portal protein